MEGFSYSQTPKDIIRVLAKDIKTSRVGYAGFSKKKYLVAFLIRQMFDGLKQNIKVQERQPIYVEKLIKEIEQVLRKARHVLPPRQYTNVFVFPSFSSFTKRRMGGISGYTPWEDVILIFVDSVAPFGKVFRNTITHEYVHSVSREYHTWKTLRDSIVFEGLAENFLRDLYDDKLSPQASSVSRSHARKIFFEIYQKLSSSDPKLYYDLFFKNTKYPLWAGYAVGYHLIAAYRYKNPTISWRDLIKKSPKDFTNNETY